MSWNERWIERGGGGMADYNKSFSFLFLPQSEINDQDVSILDSASNDDAKFIWRVCGGEYYFTKIEI